MDINQIVGTAIGVLKQISPTAAKKFQQNPQIVQQATQAYANLTHDKKGLLQAISEYGGMEMADKAVAAVKKYPIADFALKGFGVDVEQINAEVHKKNYIRANHSSTFQDKLKDLR